MAIQLSPRPLPPVEQKQIRDWLNLPGARAFQSYIARLAAAECANLGISMAGVEDWQNDAAKGYRDRMRALEQFNKFIDETRNSDKSLTVADLSHMKTPIEPQ